MIFPLGAATMFMVSPCRNSPSMTAGRKCWVSDNRLARATSMAEGLETFAHRCVTRPTSMFASMDLPAS